MEVIGLSTTRAGNKLMERDGGLGVISTNHEFAGGNPFSIEIGTSMAAPHVAHLAASILREHPDASTNFLRGQCSV